MRKRTVLHPHILFQSRFVLVQIFVKLNLASFERLTLGLDPLYLHYQRFHESSVAGFTGFLQLIFEPALVCFKFFLFIFKGLS